MSNYRNLIIQSPYDFAVFSGQLKNSLLFYDKIIIPEFGQAFSDPINFIRNRPVVELILMWKLMGEFEESGLYSKFEQSKVEKFKEAATKQFAPFLEAEETIAMLRKENLIDDHKFDKIVLYHGDKWLDMIKKAKLFKKPKDDQEKLYTERNTVWFLQDQAILEFAEKEKHTAFYELTEQESGYEEKVFGSSFPSKVENLLLRKCDFQIPNFERVSYEDILEIRRKHSDELTQARTHLAKLSFDIATKFKDESSIELEKWMEYYCTEIIRPQIKAFTESLNKDKSNSAKKILKSVAGFTSFVLSLTNWRSMLPELLKTGLELDETLKNKNTQEQSFIKCIGLTYHK